MFPKTTSYRCLPQTLDAMTENILKLVLFTAFSLVLPLFLAAPMAGDFYIPLALMGVLSLEYWVMLFNLNPFGLFVVGQFVIYIFIIYLVTKYAAKKLFNLQQAHLNAVVIIVVLCLILISFFPIYGFEAGDNLYESYHNLLRI